MSISPTIEAVVVTHDSADILPACLAAMTREGVPVIVVDNDSRDATVAVAEAAGARVLRMARNEGYGRANNAGVAASEAEFVLIANPDLVLDEGAVEALLAAARVYPDAGLLAPRIVEEDGRFFFQSRSLLSGFLRNEKGVACLPEADCCAPFLSGACLLVRREAFRAIGGFDPAIFLFYEDDDLCRRFSDAGHALVHVDGAVARHGRGKSSAPAPGRVFRSRWHQAWSRAYVSRKWKLASPAPAMFGLNVGRVLLSVFSFRRALMERYAGSAAGAWAFLRGRSALTKEGID